MRRIFLTAATVCLCGIGVFAQEPSPSPQRPNANGYVRPDSHDRVSRYLLNMFGPKALAKRVFTSAVLTWSNSPTEWGEHWDGFGKRFASATGTSIVNHTTQFGLEEAFRLDSGYYHGKGGAGDKIKNAITSPFVARDKHGRKVFGFPHVVGTYTGTIVASETWMPRKFDWRDGLKGGTLSLGADIVFNLVKEFIHK